MNPVKEIIKKYKIRPSKRLGQNFLFDRNALKKIIKTAELKSDDIVLEIGPGIGNLTRELAKKAKKVIAVEKDSKMIEILKETLKDFSNLQIIEGDVLKLDIYSYIRKEFVIRREYKIVANIPYYLTSPLIRKFLEAVDVRRQQSRQRPKLMVLMVQKEVAQRIYAKPPRMNLLAVSVQFYAKPEIIGYVSKNSFWPKPKVDSAILKISRIGTNLPRINTNLFFKIVKAGFSQPRKQIVNNLVKELKLDKEKVKNWLLKNNIQPSQRAETLKIEDWLNLTKCYKIKQ